MPAVRATRIGLAVVVALAVALIVAASTARPAAAVRSISRAGAAKGHTIKIFKANLGFVSDVATDSHGNVYIAGADSNGGVVRRVSPDGTMTTVAGGGPVVAGENGDGGLATKAYLPSADYIAVDGRGDLFISIYNGVISGGVRKVSPNGIITTVVSEAETGSGCLQPGSSSCPLPNGVPAAQVNLTNTGPIAVDQKGNLYIGSEPCCFVAKVTPDGTMTTVAGDDNGFTPSGDGGPATKATLAAVRGLAVDSRGNLFIAGNYRVREVTPNGTITTFAGTGQAPAGVGPGSGDGGAATKAKLDPNEGVAVDAAGNLYTTGSYRRVRKISPGGTITAFAGGGSSGNGGPATKVALTQPAGIAVDPAGNVYIGDRTRVWEVTNAAPTAAFTATPATGKAPLRVGFNASASKDPDGLVTSYSWNFGDGKTGTGKTARHTYAHAGRYTVKLTVTDDSGAHRTRSHTIKVT